MTEQETMSLKQGFWRDRYLLTRPDWGEYEHIEIQAYYPWGYKAGNVRKRGRLTMQPWVMRRDGDGERKLDKPSEDGWIEWVAPADATEKAKEFGWETYKT